MYTGLILASLALRVAIAGSGNDPKLVERAYEFMPIKDNRIGVAKEKGRTLFLVTSPFGIGQATIRLKAGQWPQNIALRFQYKTEKGGGFGNLEHIRLTSDRLYAEGA